MDGADTVRIFGETIAVRARVHTLGGFSAHAGQTDLLKWFAALAASGPRVAIVHGDEAPRLKLAHAIREAYGLTPTLPKQNDVLEI